MNKGSYVMVLRLKEDLKISKPKEMILKKGLYVYVGSAVNSLTGRIRRHLKKGKKIHWHVDQLTEKGNVEFIGMIVGKAIEKKISVFLEKHLKFVEGFGSTDLKVKSNLFIIENEKDWDLLWKCIKFFIFRGDQNENRDFMQ